MCGIGCNMVTNTVTNTLVNLVNIEANHKVKLTIPLIASYLKRGATRADIARVCNVSHQAVSDYVQRHHDALAPLVDSSGTYQATKAQHVADMAQDRLIEHLPATDKKDLIALNAISGTHIDKYRLLSDKSTQNVSVDVVTGNIAERKKRREELLKELEDNPG